MPRRYEPENDMFSDSDDSSKTRRSNPYKVESNDDMRRESNSNMRRESNADIRSESNVDTRRESNTDIRREYKKYKKNRRPVDKEKIRREYNKYKDQLLSLEKGSSPPRSPPRSQPTSTRKSTPYSEVVRHFKEAFKATSCETCEDSDAFKYLLRKAPVAVVLHHLHFLFYVNRDSSTNTRILSSYNDKFNVVSRYFLKAMKTESRAASAMKSVDDVSKRILRKTPLVQIDNLLHFTPEFILLKTIQAGDMESHDQIVSEWELVDGFKPCRDLIAAFFGVKTFFSDTSRYTNRQAVIISCICGGSVETLLKIVKDTDTKWLTDFTMRKTREMCTPPDVMLKFLQDSYGLKM